MNSYKYTGRDEAGVGLFYYRARYYHPRLQWFISEDPLGFEAGDVNLYATVFNNPTNYTDPTGEIAPIIARCVAGMARGALPDVLDSLAKRKTPKLNPMQLAADCLTGGLHRVPNALRGAGKGSQKPSASRRPSAAVRRQVDAAATDTQGNLRCQYCGDKLTTKSGQPNSREYDHVDPWSRSRDSSADNIKDACRTCNRNKGAQNPEELGGP